MKNYWSIVKPGILFGNLISAAAGFFLASKGRINSALLLSILFGIALVVASGCVFNNLIDRNMDRKMARTCNRALARGIVSPKAAALYALVLCFAGFALLGIKTNTLTVAIVLTGFAVYVGVYTMYLKRNCVHSTLIGSLAGSAPPLAGYCAVSGRFDTGATILLLIFGLWQIPHAYAIAIHRFEDYRAAAVPVLPVKGGTAAAKNRILGFIVAFLGAAVMLTLGGYTGYGYLIVAAVLGLCWLYAAWSGYRTADDRRWARRLFALSLLNLFALSLMMSIDFATPAASHRVLIYAPRPPGIQALVTWAAPAEPSLSDPLRGLHRPEGERTIRIAP